MEMILLPHINNEGFHVNGTYMSTLMYADDILLLADNPEELEHNIQMVQNQLEKVGLQINMDKTAYVSVNKEARPLFIQDTVIKCGNTLTHLGIQSQVLTSH